jgi:phosphoglycolate phosphatase-like HAD superfamily hydrolase
VAHVALRQVRHHVHAHHAADSIWIIGDTPLDVRCARAIGAKAVAVATGSHTLDQLRAAEPDLLLRDLADVTAILANWSHDLS